MAKICDVTMLFELCFGKPQHFLSHFMVGDRGCAANNVLPKYQSTLPLDEMVKTYRVLPSGSQSAGTLAQHCRVTPFERKHSDRSRGVVHVTYAVISNDALCGRYGMRFDGD